MKKNADWVRHMLRALPLDLFCALTVTVYAAVLLYAQNADEFWFTLSQGMPGVIKTGLALLILLSLVPAVMPPKARDASLAVVLALTLSALLQMTLLNADYGLLDGKAIDWGAYTGYGIINTVTWLAILVLCLKISGAESFHRLIVVVPVLLLAVEGGHMVQLISGLPERAPETTALELTSDGLNTVGQDNLILLITDSVDAEDLTEALSSDPSLADKLDGFTFYRSALGLSDPTKYGLPAILTGQVHNQSVSYQDFLSLAYQDAPLLSASREQGMDVRVFTDSRYIDLASSRLDNAERKPVTISDEKGLTRDFLRLCAFRYAPHFLKPQLWMYSNVFGAYKKTEGAPIYQENDPLYAASLEEEGMTLRQGAALRVIHTAGMHPPYTMDADCVYHSEGVTAQEQMQGVLRIADDYLEQLKALGVYDSSDILILADHGTETVQRPMLLLKRKGERGTLRISDAPVSYADLNATYLTLLGEETDGLALWEIPEGEERTRYYYHEDSTNNLFNLYQYVTNLPAPSFGELEKTGEVYHADTGGETAPYQLGDTLYFDLRATGRPYEVSGFSSADHMSTWTSGDTGEICLPLKELPAEESVTVHMSFLSVMTGSQRLIVTCAGETVFDDTVTQMQVAFAVPSNLIKDGMLDLCFAYPDAISHKDAGKSEDTRKVAFALVSMTVLDGDGQENESPSGNE